MRYRVLLSVWQESTFEHYGRSLTCCRYALVMRMATPAFMMPLAMRIPGRTMSLVAVRDEHAERAEVPAMSAFSFCLSSWR